MYKFEKSDFEEDSKNIQEDSSSLLNIDLEGFSGPLDLLLQLAQQKKLDITKISILSLVDQYLRFIKQTKKLNLDLASDYLVMAAILAYIKSKLLLPGTPEEEFKVQEVAERLKLQLKKLELIRLLSEQMLKRKRLGREIRTRGTKLGTRQIYNSELKVNLFELLKAYSTILMTKDFQRINIPRLPVFTTEEGIKTISNFFGKLFDWKKLDDLIPKNFKNDIKFRKTGKAGIFAGSLELVKDGKLKIKQKNLFEDIYIKETK